MAKANVKEYFETLKKRAYWKAFELASEGAKLAPEDTEKIAECRLKIRGALAQAMGYSEVAYQYYDRTITYNEEGADEHEWLDSAERYRKNYLGKNSITAFSNETPFNDMVSFLSQKEPHKNNVGNEEFMDDMDHIPLDSGFRRAKADQSLASARELTLNALKEQGSRGWVRDKRRILDHLATAYGYISVANKGNDIDGRENVLSQNDSKRLAQDDANDLRGNAEFQSLYHIAGSKDILGLLGIDESGKVVEEVSHEVFKDRLLDLAKKTREKEMKIEEDAEKTRENVIKEREEKWEKERPGKKRALPYKDTTHLLKNWYLGEARAQISEKWTEDDAILHFSKIKACVLLSQISGTRTLDTLNTKSKNYLAQKENIEQLTKLISEDPRVQEAFKSGDPKELHGYLRTTGVDWRTQRNELNWFDQYFDSFVERNQREPELPVPEPLNLEPTPEELAAAEAQRAREEEQRRAREEEERRAREEEQQRAREAEERRAREEEQRRAREEEEQRAREAEEQRAREAEKQPERPKARFTPEQIAKMDRGDLVSMLAMDINAVLEQMKDAGYEKEWNDNRSLYMRIINSGQDNPEMIHLFKQGIKDVDDFFNQKLGDTTVGEFAKDHGLPSGDFENLMSRAKAMCGFVVENQNQKDQNEQVREQGIVEDPHLRKAAERVIYGDDRSAARWIESYKKEIKDHPADVRAQPGYPGSYIARIMAARELSNSTRGKASTLNAQLAEEQINLRSAEIMNNKEFKAFADTLAKPGYMEKVEGILAKKHSHGGELDDLFRDYLAMRPAGKLPDNDPSLTRWMPTAKQRIESLQKQAKAKKEPRDVYKEAAEIMLLRKAGNIRRGGAGLKNKIAVNEKGNEVNLMDEVEKLANEQSFKDAFDRSNGRKYMLSGHGGEMMERIAKASKDKNFGANQAEAPKNDRKNDKDQINKDKGPRIVG